MYMFLHIPNQFLSKCIIIRYYKTHIYFVFYFILLILILIYFILFILLSLFYIYICFDIFPVPLHFYSWTKQLWHDLILPLESINITDSKTIVSLWDENY